MGRLRNQSYRANEDAEMRDALHFCSFGLPDRMALILGQFFLGPGCQSWRKGKWEPSMILGEIIEKGL